MKNLDEDKIVNMYNSGSSLQNIATEFNVSRYPIRRILRANNVKIAVGGPAKPSKEKIEKIIKSYVEKGIGTTTLAKTFNMSVTGVIYLLKNNKVVMRPRLPKIIINDKDLISLYVNGMSIKQISDHKNLSYTAILKYLKSNKVEMRVETYPDRREKSRVLMTKRLKDLGAFPKIGIKENILIDILKQKYGEVIPQFQIEKNGHAFDAFAGGILWELDEAHHNKKSQREKDKKFDLKARELGYQVRRIKDSNLEVTGIDVYYSYQLYEEPKDEKEKESPKLSK